MRRPDSGGAKPGALGPDRIVSPLAHRPATSKQVLTCRWPGYSPPTRSYVLAPATGTSTIVPMVAGATNLETRAVRTSR